MTPQQIDAFLKEPRIADLATVRPDGSPHVAPVWYLYDGPPWRVKVMTDKGSVKVRNLRHDPRVSLSIATDVEPYEYVLVSGEATISYDGIPELLHTISVHYKGEEEGRRYAASAIKELDFCILTIIPSKVTAWSDAD